MPENWLLPQTTSNYATGVIQAINNKFIDAITLFRLGVGSNIPVNAIRYNGDINGTFQRWNGSVWNDMILAVAGGGTGGSTGALARTNLGLGTMSTQNSNAVDISGGNIVNIGSFSANTVYGNAITTPNGAGIAGINAANISTGLINPARLANGAANSGVFLRGDQTWGSPAGTLPSGLIAIFDVSCPAGWTRVAALDGRMPRGSTVYGGAGGSDTHSHTHSLAGNSHSHSSGTYATPSHNHGGSTGNMSISVSVSGNTGSGGGHSHGFNGETGGESSGIMGVDAGGSGNMTRGPHTHDFSGETDSVGNHTHSFSGSGSGSNSASIPSQGGMGISGTSGANDVTMSGGINAASHMPYYLDVVYCRKD
jgi:hypothetical protein